MKINTSMLSLLALLEFIVWTSSNHVNLKNSSGTLNTIKTLIKLSNSNELQLKNKSLNTLDLRNRAASKNNQSFEKLIHKESKTPVINFKF